MIRYVLDSSSLLVFLEDRPGASLVEELLGKSVEHHRPIFMTVLNWGELFQSVVRAKGEAFAKNKMTELRQLPIELVHIDESLSLLAASFSLSHDLAYLDSFPIALARTRKAILVTANQNCEFPNDVKRLIVQ
jgi:predicted nucleic acid-binding protein